MEFNTKCMHKMYHMASSHLQSIRTAHRLFKPHIRSNVRLRNTTIIICDISTPLSYVMQSMLCLISCYLTGCAVAIQRCSGRQEGASRTRCCCKPRRLLSHGILRRLKHFSDRRAANDPPATVVSCGRSRPTSVHFYANPRVSSTSRAS